MDLFIEQLSYVLGIVLGAGNSMMNKLGMGYRGDKNKK